MIGWKFSLSSWRNGRGRDILESILATQGSDAIDNVVCYLVSKLHACVFVSGSSHVSNIRCQGLIEEGAYQA